MLERVTPDDIAAVVEALVNKAKAGDTAAAKLLFDRVFGRVADHDAAAAGKAAKLPAGAFARRQSPPRPVWRAPATPATPRCAAAARRCRRSTARSPPPTGTSRRCRDAPSRERPPARRRPSRRCAAPASSTCTESAGPCGCTSGKPPGGQLPLHVFEGSGEDVDTVEPLDHLPYTGSATE